MLTQKHTELVHFDLDLALGVVKTMGCEGVIQQIAKKPSAPTNLQEFLSCFVEGSVQDEFLERYVDQL